MDRIIRERECRQLTGLGRTSRWDQERQGLFPRRRRLSANAVGWLESEVRAWIVSRAPSGARAPAAMRTARQPTSDDHERTQETEDSHKREQRESSLATRKQR